MRLGQQMLGGLVAGALGAGIWIAIAYFTGYEVGFVAWGVRLLVGLGAMSASAGRGSPIAAVAAGLIAIAAILGGKAGTALLVADEIRHELGLDGQKTKEMVVSAIAEDVLAEATDTGMHFDDEWPPGVLDEEDVRAFYPPQVWREAERRWYELTASEQMALRSRVETSADASMGLIFVQVFFAGFGLFDVLWLVLGSMSAFKIASVAAEDPIPGPPQRTAGVTVTQPRPAPAAADDGPRPSPNFLPMRTPDAEPSNVPLSRRGVPVDQLGGAEIPNVPPYADRPPAEHADVPDLDAAPGDDRRRAA